MTGLTFVSRVFLTAVTIQTAVLTLMIAPGVIKEEKIGGFYIVEVLAMCILAFGGLWAQ